MTKPSISHHFAVLKGADLIRSRRELAAQIAVFTSSCRIAYGTVARWATG
jgi:hypothetical protein